MTEPILVTCQIDRCWAPEKVTLEGEQIEDTCVEGELLEITTQSAPDNPGKLIPVGIVVLEDGTFQSVPVEFIRMAQK